MSRSNPHVSTPNPAVRFFEWNGETGVLHYYDKEQKKEIECGSEMTFLLLDKLATVKGWHDASSSGIVSNEVRDTTQDRLVVRAWKGGTLAEGLWKSIKDTVNKLGGDYHASLYCAVKIDGVLSLCCLQLKRSALSAWMDFSKSQRAEFYRKAIAIHGYTEGKKGRIVYRVPVFELKDVSDETQSAAVALDIILQTYLTAYLARNTREQAEDHTPADDPDDSQVRPLTDDEIPFAWLLPWLPVALAAHTLLT